MTEIRFVPRPAHAHRPREVWPPAIGIVHATRGHTSLELQDQATVRWFTESPANGGAPDQGGWGPTADCLVSADEDVVYVFEESIAALRRWRSSWSAGFGPIGSSVEWGADEVGISVEVAQSAALEPYSADTVGRLVFLLRRLQAELGFTLPARRIPYWSQSRGQFVPTGYIGHEDLANGVKTGKSDPGGRFPWDGFLAQLQEEDEMREIALTQVEKIRAGVGLKEALSARFSAAANLDPTDGWDVSRGLDPTVDVVVVRMPKGTVFTS